MRTLDEIQECAEAYGVEGIAYDELLTLIKIAKAVAVENPSGWSRGKIWCRFCRSVAEGEDWNAVAHRADCPWVAAWKLVGQSDVTDGDTK